MFKILAFINLISSYPTALIIIGVGLFTLLYDGKRFMHKGYIRELKIVKAISYTYMGIGGLMFLLLLLM